ncbi:MAG: bifunctional (p)ppGpp synthetase/guanosine-3',5'-bis(diphosphate) 3'-pyrophosphohydrolase [Clostridia bacterium]|nr:bifunctional (p)ppGpp synthetase/guanosine-3',5'-bis(diphosphate) 3'-pyrophosphohydrolase [Clostridia bacterium]
MEIPNNSESILDRAIDFAKQAHYGIKRKACNLPYIVHPLEVMSIAASMTEDTDVLTAALLHDVAEDTEHTLQEIYEMFGEKVGDLVSSETEDKMGHVDPSETWLRRKEMSLEVLRTSPDINVKILWLSDKLSNLRSFYINYQKRGEDLWNSFNQKDPKMHHWYHTRVAELTSELSHTFAWKEYTYLIKKLFEDDKDGEH